MDRLLTYLALVLAAFATCAMGLPQEQSGDTIFSKSLCRGFVGLPESWHMQLQLADGSWDADAVPGPKETTVQGGPNDDLAVTSWLTLCLLSGNTNSNGASRRTRVTNATTWLVSQQLESGRIGKVQHDNSLKHHALAALALCEDAMSLEAKRNQEATRDAIRFIVDSSLLGGGWSASGFQLDKDRNPRDLDPETTLWAAMALRAAEDAGVTDARASLEAAANRFRRMSDPQTGQVHGGDNKATLCALLTRQFEGEDLRAIPRVFETIDQLIAERPKWSADPIYYYISTMLNFALDCEAAVERRKVWEKILKPEILGKMAQRDLRGKVVASTSAPVCGSLASSAVAQLSISIYFRFTKLLGAR